MTLRGSHRLLCIALLGSALPTSADAARQRPNKAGVEEPAQWETAAGRDQARLEFARGLLNAGAADACLELIAQLRRDGVRGIELERLHAEALRATGLDDDAQQVLEGVVKRWPRDAAAHNELGILAMDRKDLPTAVAHFEQAVRFDKSNGRYLNNLGFALLTSDRADEAIEALRAALRMDSSKTQTRNNLGFALVAAGREQEALRVFRAASRNNADAHYNVGVGLELRGASAQASESYQRALKADPAHVRAQSALQRLTPAEGPPTPSDPLTPTPNAEP
ncbi:MAG: hypothetical protein CL927_03815 [Deltaproteobacteria bacterium]|nr:hypothetical protein [Deltaproteobacteria bacterium]